MEGGYGCTTRFAGELKIPPNWLLTSTEKVPESATCTFVRRSVGLPKFMASAGSPTDDSPVALQGQTVGITAGNRHDPSQPLRHVALAEGVISKRNHRSVLPDCKAVA